MHRCFGRRIPIVVIALTVWASVACGSDSAEADDPPAETATPATEQTQVAVQPATATQPEADPSPTTEPEPAATSTTEQATVAAPAPTAILEPVASETPAEEQAVIDSCGGTTLSYFPWETEIPNNIDQWNRIIGAANEITTSWNDFVAATDAVLDYDTVVGNESVISAATLLIGTIDAQYPVISAETDPATLFAPLAESELISADAIKELAQLTLTAAGGDVDAWNTSIDQWGLVSSAIDGASVVHDIACDYWVSVGS